MSRYSKNAKSLAVQYEGLSFKDVHPELFKLRGKMVGLNVLDVGSGSGRDASFFASHGASVVAVEPVDEFIEIAKILHDSQGIYWVKDMAPELTSLRSFGHYFDLIVCSAVVMELTEKEVSQLALSFDRLLRKEGQVYLTVKLEKGCSESIEKRTVLMKSFEGAGFEEVYSEKSDDLLGRGSSEWQTFIFNRVQ